MPAKRGGSLHRITETHKDDPDNTREGSAETNNTSDVDDTESRFVQERHRRLELERQMKDLQQQMAALIQQTAGSTQGTPPPVPPAEGSRPEAERLLDPPVFYNQKSKDTVKFETWFRQVKNKILVNASRFPTDLS